MATVLYGGSPRRHHHIHHQNALQSQQQQSTSHISHYMATSTISLQQQQHHQHHHQTQQQQQQQQQISHHQQQIHSHIQYQQQQQSHYHHSTLMYPGINSGAGGGGGGRHHHKRRSAVEMLAESKQFYVKSETVLDRNQHLAYRSAGSREGIVGRETTNSPGGAIACILSPVRTLSHHHHHHHHLHGSSGGGGGRDVRDGGGGIISQRPPNRRSASSSSDLLQTKLRKLLNADSKECPVPEIPRYKGNAGTVVSGVGKKYDTFSKYQTVKYHQELSIHPSNDQCDSNVLFPSAFLSPQSLPPHPVSDDEIYSYGIDEPLILTDDYRAISPPAEYAAVDSSPEKDQRSNYQRSYSHSHEVASDDPDYSSPSYNINSHKSLPDLHSQISRHSPHSEVLSCCSRGNRSNKSGGGSSLNRDSGGSSGHYTHRSEPCCKQRDISNKMYVGAEYRRDSGSSTQHSGNSYYTYGITSSSRYDCPECRAKYQKDSECLLNFTTPEVPEAFQDEYPDQSPPHQSIPKGNNRYYEENKLSSRKLYTHSSKMHQHQQSPPTPRTPDSNGGGASGIGIKEQELSPPLGTFKRQKCFRFKQRNRYSTSNDRTSCRTENVSGGGGIATISLTEEDRKPILRSKSDISDRYWNRGSPMTEQLQSNKLSNVLDKRGKSESLSQLEKFFDRLGLNDEKFEEIYSPSKRRFSSDNESDESSTVFFSDVSTVDSTRLPDSTETQPLTQPYRPTEQPSIVERNARIIKWLCNCRKLALT